MGGRLAKVVAFLGLAVIVWVLMIPRADPPTSSSRFPTTEVSDSATSAPVPSTPASSTTEESTTPSLRSATIGFSGDVLLHSRVWRVAAANAEADDPDGFDFTPMFGPIQGLIDEADWSVCHLEVNLDAENQNLSSFPVFRGPGAIAEDLREVGFDACSTASNHSLDWGTNATFETIDVLEAAGLRAIGTARTSEEVTSNIWFDIEDIRIAHLGYTYWFNGFQLPDDQPWAANQIDEQRILADAATARSTGADLVILSLHWGDQYRHRPSQQQADLGPRLLASADIDLVIGHHAHVVQPIDRIDGEWLVHGMGNLLSNQTQPARRDELIVEATIVEEADGSFVVDQLRVIPVFVDGDTLTIWPSGRGLRTDDVPDRLAPALDASWERVVDVLMTGSGWDDLELVGS